MGIIEGSFSKTAAFAAELFGRVYFTDGGRSGALYASNELTELLHEWRTGNQEVLARIISLAYPDAAQTASACLKNECPGHTLQATALVNETYCAFFICISFLFSRWLPESEDPFSTDLIPLAR